ncbi:MAG TPA: flagellar biosynthetic protein FliQ [Opitutaceae bacterium]|jgi:flagellar biosynthesis protein FliQ|nr:flagellar biosynthetic protein FliQ [Opitutaceae bacterium]HOR24413.1 flagellar biosynthetic protein FliQ [Opitutaceae bacterium]HPK49193.1 flagellar biosynthetic protein FliQ [Opitutaceae bacterium]
MTPELAIDLFKSTVFFALYMVAPFLGVILIVGLITSLLQSVTSIQEQTLTFAPKLLTLALMFIFLGPWLLRSTTEFATQMFTRMGTLGH